MSNLPNRSLLAEAQRILAFLDKYPYFKINEGGRFFGLCTAISVGTENIISPTRPDFVWVLQALRDVSELNFVFDVLGEDYLAKHRRDTLHRAFRDSELPDDGAERSPGRDHQCELFTHAILRRGGLKPEPSKSGPDFVIRSEGRTYVVECKRIKSIEKLAARAEAASDQVQRSGFPGFIVMDVSRAVHDGNPFYTGPADDDIGFKVQARLNQFVDRHRHVLEASITSSHVSGLVLVEAMTIQHGQPNAKGVGRWITHHLFNFINWPIDADDERGRRRRFFRSFTFGMPRYETSMF
jgi:hypothetical protein